MLVDFSVENYGPFRDRVTLDMRATNLKGHSDNLIECGSIKADLISSALIFGPNASGKSYLFDAMLSLKLMVEDAFPDDKKYPWYRPFKLDERCKSSPVSFQIRLCEDGVLYDYSISFLSDRIVSESLVYYPLGRARTAFVRKGSNDEFRGKGRRLLSLLNQTTSYLALGSKYNDELCSKVRKSIRDLITLQSSDLGYLIFRSCRFVENDNGMRKMMIGGLQKADLGITDYEIVEQSIDSKDVKRILSAEEYEMFLSDGQEPVKRSGISVKHRYSRLFDDTGVEATFDMDSEESEGTRCMFGIMGPLVDSLVNGKTILIDEFGSHLHPLLTRWLVEQFSKRNNPRGAQLIAMTHDVGLIDTGELVRRDQVFFTDKNREDGSSTLYCLSD
ncbi:MAG: AAA family ATPase, partial [Candidatus Methanomethylophilaceae archaeon]|nr:AAA family ATPase [Candidatus Methanomethylophilaceae archaeon]